MITALSTATSGINANMTALSVIGNNIANVNTVGFKAGRALFSDVLSQSLTGGSQIGLGTKLSSVDTMFTQGAFESTSNGLDLALDGEGFFVVNDSSGASYYTRAGEFSIDKDGNIVNADGYILQGYGIDNSGNILSVVDDLQISYSAIPANSTSKIELTANLQSDSDVTGFVFTTGTNDQIMFNEDAGGGNTTISLTTDGGLTSGTAYTGDEVASAIETALEAQSSNSYTYTVAYNGSTGEFSITNDSTNSNTVDILWDNASTTAETTLGFDATATNNIAVGGTDTSDNVAGAFDVNNASSTSNYSTSITAYDSLGNSHLVTIYFRKSDITATGNEWDWYAVVDAGDSESGSTEVQASGTLTFNTEGELNSQSAVTYPIDGSDADSIYGFQFTGGATLDQTIAFDFDNLTQYGSDSSVYSQTQDGYASGSLQSISVDTDGMVSGSYSNGKTRSIGQIAVAKFSNQSGLVSAGSNLYAETADSGQASVGTAGSSGRASVQSGALELSNVDLSNEFVKLIAAQRGFQANSRIITTSDEILQELVNLKR